MKVRITNTAVISLALAGIAIVSTGCTTTFGPKAEHGIVFYCPGAGNVDFGGVGVREGLEKAGFRGEVRSLLWTISFNPAIDQAVRLNARFAGTRLARLIEDYTEQYPNGRVSLIGLSAGSGVAIWALEDLKEGYYVDNVVLLGSSLSSNYDVSKALRHVHGKIYVYYSSKDAVLAGPMKLFGTIDGVFQVDGAGAVGLRTPRGADRVVNIAWRPEYKRYGYAGGHVDSTNPRFVEAVIAPHILGASRSARLGGALATLGE